jgi:hypothetical protein
MWALVRDGNELLSDEIAIPERIDSSAFQARILNIPHFQDDLDAPIEARPFINTNSAQRAARRFPRPQRLRLRASVLQDLAECLGTLEMDDVAAVFKERLQGTLQPGSADVPVRRGGEERGRQQCVSLPRFWAAVLRGPAWHRDRIRREAALGHERSRLLQGARRKLAHREHRVSPVLKPAPDRD